MSKEYTRAETLYRLNNVGDFSRLYNKEFIKQKGKTKDTEEYYTEVMAKELEKNKQRFEKIKQITRKSTYKWHKPVPCGDDMKKSLCGEVTFAKMLFCHQASLGELGQIIEYQVPLNDERADKAGKIDLVSETEDSLHLIEFKYDSKDTLLRAVLEIETYSRQLCDTKFLKDFGAEKKEIQKSILLFGNCRAFDEAEEIKKDKRPALKKLIETLNVSIYQLELLFKVVKKNLRAGCS